MQIHAENFPENIFVSIFFKESLQWRQGLVVTEAILYLNNYKVLSQNWLKKSKVLRIDLVLL